MFLTLIIVVFIFIMQFVWLQIDDLVGKGLTWDTILEFLGWFALANIPTSLPLSSLIASLMTLGNLGENNELLAMKSSGISLHRILYSLYLTILFVAAGSFILSNEFVPYAYLKARSMLMEIKKKSPELSIPEDIFYDGIEQFGIRVDKKDPLTGALIGVMIYDHTHGDGNYSVTIADTGYIKQTQDARYIVLRLINGTSYAEELTRTNRLNKPAYPFHRRYFKEQTVAIDLGAEESQSYEAMYKDHPSAKSMSKLNRDSDSVRVKIRQTVTQFDDEQLSSNNSFKYSIKQDTARKRTKTLSLNVDSIYNSSTAQQKMNYLNQIESNLARISGYWTNELYMIQVESRNLKNIDYERHRKFTLAFSCIIFFFIGAPLGAIIRKGGLGSPVVISIFFFVIYWVIDTICTKMVRNSDWSPIFGAWFPSFVLAIVAFFLTYKANTDSQIFNPDSYKRFFDVLFGRMKRLMTPVDLDKIVLLPNAQIPDAARNNNANTKRMSQLIDSYLDSHKSGNKSGVRMSISQMNDNEELREIKSLYDYLLSFYVTIDNDENLRSLIRRFPLLELSEFTFPQYLTKPNVFLKAPYTLILALMKIRRTKKLEYILDDIKNINIDVNKYYNERYKS
jgi:lipopolysaccharide export system permease protein